MSKGRIIDVVADGSSVYTVVKPIGGNGKIRQPISTKDFRKLSRQNKDAVGVILAIPILRKKLIGREVDLPFNMG